ncbi:MAG TPA: nodulation protein NfeD [Ramlibacter sp.]|nr:nodulation protein NfeD [Ramlibacter sp.]
MAARTIPIAWRALRRALLLLCLGTLACLPALAAPTAPTAPGSPVLVLEVQDAIGPASASYIVRGIARAEAAGAPLLVIRLDTPGGLDTSMRQVIQAILAARVPVAVYVSPEGARAASAGTYILYAAHVAAMAPATTLGAATPVAIGLGGGERKPAEKDKDKAAGQDAKEAGPADPMTTKQVHDAAAFIRGLAQQRGRNADWAERAVREAVTLTASEAVRDKVADLVAADVPDLLAQVDGRRVRLQSGEVTLATRGRAVQVVAPDWRQRLLSVIANPSFALVLLMIGFYGLLFEFTAPGYVVPGTVGAICLLLALYALQLLPVNYAGLGLIVLGLALLAAEHMAPSFGVLGVGGVVAICAGALLLFDRDVPELAVPLWLVAVLGLASGAVAFAAGGMALRARRRPVVTGAEQMIGARGIVLPPDAIGSWAQVFGERWRVTSDSDLQPGQSVRVLAREGLTLHVRPDD